MKKIVFLLTLFVAMSFATSCGNATKGAEADSTAVDSVDTVAVDTVVADTVAADSVVK